MPNGSFSIPSALRHPALLLLLAAVLRILFLSDIPNGFTTDEASTGYDAYSILATGRDQHGEFLPFFAQSFGDYNESLYRFITVPSIAVFGLNEFATRLPAALAGVLTVWIVYLLGKTWHDEHLAWNAALLLAISPWHIFFSRTAFRLILLPLCCCLGLYFFQRGLQRPRDLPFSAAFFALSMYSYSSARVSSYSSSPQAL